MITMVKLFVNFVIFLMNLWMCDLLQVYFLLPVPESISSDTETIS